MQINELEYWKDKLLTQKTHILFAFLILFSNNYLLANENNKNTSITYLPIIYYTPETKLAGGGLINYNHYNPDDTTFAFPSTIMPHIVYTLKGQLITEIYTD